MADATFIVLDAALTTVTFRAQSVVGTTLVMMSVPSNLAGTAMIGQGTMASSLPVAIASNQSNVPFNLVAVNGTVISLGQQVATGSIPVVIATGQLASVGQTTMAGSFSVAIASDQTNVPMGVVGYTSFPSAVANAARVPLIGDKMGRLLSAGSARDWKATQTTVLTTAAETVIVNPVNATTFADIYGLILANGGATASAVNIRYGTGSAIVQNFYVPAGDTRGYMLPVDSAVPGSLQTANVSWTAQLLATTNMTVSAFYVKTI